MLYVLIALAVLAVYVIAGCIWYYRAIRPNCYDIKVWLWSRGVRSEYGWKGFVAGTILMWPLSIYGFIKGYYMAKEEN